MNDFPVSLSLSHDKQDPLTGEGLDLSEPFGVGTSCQSFLAALDVGV